MSSEDFDISGAASPLAGGVRLTVKARPGISKRRPPRFVDIGDGKTALEITVAEAAEDGKATRAILEQLAEHLRVKKNALELKTGASSRLKLVDIAGDPAVLLERLKSFRT